MSESDDDLDCQTVDSAQAARWMIDQLHRTGFLNQNEAAYGLKEEFGPGATYINRHGNLAINREILEKFRGLTEDSIVWNHAEKQWRFREDYDPEGKRGIL